MRESFEIVSSSDRYLVIIGRELVSEVLEKYPDAIFLVDDFFDDSLSLPAERRISIHADEETKSLERMSEVIVKLRQMGANRSTHLVAIGGGVIQDIATFAASLYMRGVSWTYMPTTLLSMADSCIGGKSSINVAGIKNLVGNFYPPKEILVDLNFAKTLDSEQIIGGLFEAEKICYARGADTYDNYLALTPCATMSSDSLQKLVSLSLHTKQWFIEIDEFDQKERLLLNYGHTFGHAVEAGTDFAVSHGIAVGVGMLIAVRYAELKNLVLPHAQTRVQSFAVHVKSMLGSVEFVKPTILNIDVFMKKFEGDKKHKKDFYRMVCPALSGELELISEVKNQETRTTIRMAYELALRDIGWNTSD
jgi:3-dehydroquinate synthase